MHKKQKGFIKAILLIIVALVILKYVFNVNLSDLINNQIVQDLWSIFKQIFLLLWQAVVLVLSYVKSAIPQIQHSLNSVPKPTN